MKMKMNNEDEDEEDEHQRLTGEGRNVVDGLVGESESRRKDEISEAEAPYFFH
jgi:hypothetical protein